MSVLSIKIAIMPLQQTSLFLPSLRLQSRHGPNTSWLLREGNLPSAVERKLLQSKAKWSEWFYLFIFLTQLMNAEEQVVIFFPSAVINL